MINTMVMVKSVLENHEQEGQCDQCDPKGKELCPSYRVANDWLRQHNDLCLAWRNRTGKEIFVVRKFACAICSEKDTGLICVECIADVQKGEELEANEMCLDADEASDA
jgi:hypothetical protein